LVRDSAAFSDGADRRVILWMFGFVRPVRGLAATACLILLLWIVADVLVVRQTALAVDGIQRLGEMSPANSPGFWSWAFRADAGAGPIRNALLILAGCTALLAVLSFLREVINAKLSMTMVFGIREAVYDRLQRAGFAFHESYSTGELINRCLTDLQHVRTFLQSAILLTLEIVLIVGGYLVLLSTRSVWVAALALVPLPAWTWYVLRFGRRIQPAMRAAMEAGDRNVSLINENVAGAQVVKAFGAESLEIARYHEHCDSYLARIRARIRIFANFTPVLRGIAAASHLSLFALAAVLILRGVLNAGDILMLGSAMGAILGRLQQVSALNDQYQHAIVSARRLREILDAEPTIREASSARALPNGSGTVEFERVTFGYDPAKPVLRDVSFRIEGGRTLAIIGPTGAGKSTLVHLLARFYDPQQGRILVDGVDLRDVSLESLRREIAIVFQESYLFNEAVDSNIAYGRPGLSHGPVEMASRLAQAHEFVEEMAGGYQAVLGERGATLSGGQRQRLAIARALATDPRILILDDATASVDAETEDLIRRGTGWAMHGRTTVIVAHRITSVQRADRVAVLESGRVTHIGTHAELMQVDGHYREIARAQLQPDSEADAGKGSSAPPSAGVNS